MTVVEKLKEKCPKKKSYKSWKQKTMPAAAADPFLPEDQRRAVLWLV